VQLDAPGNSSNVTVIATPAGQVQVVANNNAAPLHPGLTTTRVGTTLTHTFVIDATNTDPK